MNRLFFIALSALPLFSLGQAATEAGFTITGNVSGVKENAHVFLIDASDPKDTVARGMVKGGNVSLNGKTGEPRLYELGFEGSQQMTPLFMGNDKVAVSGPVGTLKATGSSSNDDFAEFQTTFTPYFSRLNTFMQYANSPEGAKQRDSLFPIYKKMTDTIQGVVDLFIQKKHSSYVSPFVLIVVNQLSEGTEAQEKRLRSLSPEVQKGFYGQFLQKQLDEANARIKMMNQGGEDDKFAAVGSQAMDFIQNDAQGRAISLSSFKGKYVLVDFWASWCRPCRMENPNVVTTYNKFKDKNFTVLGVSLDQTRAPWLQAIKDDGLSWTQVSDLKFWNNAVAVQYHVQSIPTNLLIDPTGKIVGKNLRGPDLQAKLCQLLGCN